MKVAVIGAGWAGMAAAIAHTQAGHQVTVFEAARTVGGRARAVPGTLPDGSPVTLDNGQHILIGAYATSLRLMRLVGVDTDSALLRLPLTLQFPDGQGLQLPDLPPPLDALLGIARAKGWHWRDKLALLRTATGWQLRGFRCAPQTSVAELCAALTPRLMAEFIDPLCVSALNTPACEASGQVFLRVLQDSLFSGRGGSNLLLPRTDLGALLHHEAITTVYALAASDLTRPMLALPATAQHPAQFVFDRGQLGGPRGLLAFVISASTGERETLQRRVVAQAREQLGLVVEPLRTITEKRATFACKPGLQRPPMAVAPGLLACGDYIAGPYPATLEGAVRSGRDAGNLP
jgi:hypothetical protein